MDPKHLNDIDLDDLMQLFRECAVGGRNRFFLDLLVVVQREASKRHITTEITDYSDRELESAVMALKPIVDQCRNQGVPDSYAGLRFLMLAMTAALVELERRAETAAVH